MTLTLLQIGKAKSGNYWLYKIIQEVFDASGIERKSFIKGHPIFSQARKWQLSHKDQVGMDVISIDIDDISFRVSDKFEEAVIDVDDYIKKCSHVWTHSLFYEQQLSFYQKFDKIVYLVRDPRDVALSMARFAFTPYVLEKEKHYEKNEKAYLRNRLYGSTLAWVKHVGIYLLYRDILDIHFIFYERLKYDFLSEIVALLSYLDLALSQDAVIEIREKTSFSRMKVKEPKHVQKGNAYQWVNGFTSKQKSQVLRIAKPMLNLLGYPIVDVYERGKLPSVPHAIDIDKIENAIEISRGTLLDKLRYARNFLRSRRPFQEKIDKGFRFIVDKPVQ